MNRKDIEHRYYTDHWFSQQGISVAHIYVGTAELFQATKMATNTLKHFQPLLENIQVLALTQFLKATRCASTRQRITQGQCFRVLNIAKQAQRMSAKVHKQRIKAKK
jgi:hypothetical protein